MNVTFKTVGNSLTKNKKELYKNFCKFLQKKIPLKDDLTITFVSDRIGKMTTGSQHSSLGIKVLLANRLNRDILRTIAHEWVHVYQRLILKRPKGPNIGGKNEDEANAYGGSLLKMFEEMYPDLDEIIYEEKNPLYKKLNVINEKLISNEKFLLTEDLLNEMKRIGIDKLPYSYSSLKSFIDPETMNIHYNKHYKGYVKKLNDALSKKNYCDLDLEEIIKSINKYDDTIRNNAGGAFNHALFWKMLSPKKQIPKKEILQKINKDFGNIKNLKDEFNETAKKRFGSGWVWLILNKQNKLKIISTPNQDNPLMNVVKNGGYPLLGLDLWEHAYYLKYRNKRDEYIKKFWNFVNWEFVNELFVNKTKKKLNESYLRVLLENEETQPDLKRAMNRELQKIRLIPLDGESANAAINNIITTETEQRELNFTRTIQGLMTLDLSKTSERTRFRFNNYYQRFIKSRSRGLEFEGLIAGLLGGEISEGINTPYDIITPEGFKISCKIIRGLSENIVLKGVSYSLNQYIADYKGSEENRQQLIQMSETPNPISYLINSENQDFKNIAEDLIDYLLKDIDGLLIGVPKENYEIALFYFDKNKVKNILQIPNMTVNPKTKGSKQIRFSTQILKLKDTQYSPMIGGIKFPFISQEEYAVFLLGDEKTKEILNILNTWGEKYGVVNLGGNIPQDIIRKLSQNQRFQFDMKRILK